MSTIRPYYRPESRPRYRRPNLGALNQEPHMDARRLGLVGGAAVGALAGSQAPVLGALFGGVTGLVGGFATGYLAGSTIACELGGNRTACKLVGLAVGASTATLAYPGAALLAATAASPAVAVALGVVGGVAGYIVAQQMSR